jgi:TetR/AcrR family transcriptional regulator, transcriptional repressor for nem operon
MAYDWQKHKKQITEDKILVAAARFMRTKGLAGASVANVMKAAGLTVGGFYAHFSSKEDLIKKTFLQMSEEVQRFVAKLPGKTGKARAKMFFDIYLSPNHRDSLEKSCPVAAIVTEVGREGAPVRRIFAEELERLFEQRVETFFESNPTKEQIARSYAFMSTYVGALVLARATRGNKISDEILDATKSFLVKQLEEK